MRKSTSRSDPPARVPAPLSTTTPTGLHLPRGYLPGRRIRTPAFAAAKRFGTSSAERSSGPVTLLHRWKIHGGADHPEDSLPQCAPKALRNAGRDVAPAVSSRKLAAGIWHLQQLERGETARARLGFQPNPGHLHTRHDCNHNSFDLHGETTNEFSRRIQVQYPRSGLQNNNFAHEGATKWDPGFSKASDEAYRSYNHLKVLQDQQVSTLSGISSLWAELDLARARITELEVDQRSAKEKLDHFQQNLAEEKASWQSREQEKMRAIIDAMKDDMRWEKKNRRRLEIINSNLVNELAKVKLSAKCYLQDYEKERKGRELMEEVCDELAKEITEDKDEVEVLKRDLVKLHEEVDEERKMLQMAEVWREERVQMKLIDARLVLEEKYSQLSKLQADIEAFLRTRRSGNPDVPESEVANMLREAVRSVKMQEIKEFSYQPLPASENIFSVFEELKQRDGTREREIDQSQYSHGMNGLLEEPMKRCGYGFSDRTGLVGDDSYLETVSQREEQGSSNSPEGSDTDLGENGNKEKFREISETYSSMTKQPRKKTSSINRLWRSSYPDNGENYKKHSVEVTNKRLSNGRISNAVPSPSRKSEGGLSSSGVGQWSSPDSLNPHITRGTKGCIEWPLGMQKQRLKSKLLEARMECQKIQLRHVLKQKI